MAIFLQWKINGQPAIRMTMVPMILIVTHKITENKTETRWCPPQLEICYDPMKTIDMIHTHTHIYIYICIYIYISPTKTIVIGVISQVSYLGGTTL